MMSNSFIFMVISCSDQYKRKIENINILHKPRPGLSIEGWEVSGHHKSWTFQSWLLPHCCTWKGLAPVSYPRDQKTTSTVILTWHTMAQHKLDDKNIFIVLFKSIEATASKSLWQNPGEPMTLFEVKPTATTLQHHGPTNVLIHYYIIAPPHK